jgi:hypothetical protein
MENKIDIVELLKGCPKDMELDCTMYEDVYFDYVDELNMIHCYIQHETYKTSLILNQDGTPNSIIKSKCVIYPKGKTTWEGFQIPFKDGDIIYLKSKNDCTEGLSCNVGLVSIYKNENSYLFYDHCSVAVDTGTFYLGNVYGLIQKNEIGISRLASEEEKEKIFKAIKDNGYRWNSETKTLERLIAPKFKVGDMVKYIISGETYIISHITQTGYVFKNEGGLGFTFAFEEFYELTPSKFHVNTLNPFDKVLVRNNSLEKWHIQFFEKYNKQYGTKYPFVCMCEAKYSQCVPYEGNEHLLDTANDCVEFYKNWK